MKRRLDDSTVVSRRPKRMIVPSSENEWLSPVYEWDWDRFLDETTQQRIPRPLPSSTVLSSLVPAPKGLDMPLLQNLRSEMKNYQSDRVQNENGALSETFVDAIDDASCSTLTRGQHVRYLQLESGSESWNEARRNEFRKLSQRVQQEQEAYRQALDQFWEQHKNRFKAGLTSPVARYCMAHAKQYQSQYRGSRYFGPCVQVISLQHVSQTALTSARINNNNVTLDALSCQIVHEGETRGKQIVVDDWEKTVPVFREADMPTLVLLQDDVLATQLAKQHGASIVTTEETLQTLLQVSGDESTHWMIPVTKQQNDIVVLDVPVPFPTTPRECVSRGVTEGLYQSLSPEHDDNGYTFSLLTLPAKARSTTRSRKVLVRSKRGLLDAQQENPLRIHTQLEYFQTRGWEESTSYERSLWILDQILCKRATTLVARVDPTTIKVVQWEEVGVAHALLMPKNPLCPQINPLDHFEALVEVMHAMETLAHGEHLLCLPPASTSISVHKACADEDSEKVLDVMEELEKADVVYTGAAALRRCARLWRWKEDRVPFTFPIKQDETSRKASKSM